MQFSPSSEILVTEKLTFYLFEFTFLNIEKINGVCLVFSY